MDPMMCRACGSMYVPQAGHRCGESSEEKQLRLQFCASETARAHLRQLLGRARSLLPTCDGATEDAHCALRRDIDAALGG
jgi:hypothetical protein